MNGICVLPRAFRLAHQIPLSSSRRFEELFCRATCSPLRKPLAGWGQIQGIFSFAGHLLTTRAYILQTCECLFQTREFPPSTLPADTRLHLPKRSLEYASQWSMDQRWRHTSSPASSHAPPGVSICCEAAPRREVFCSHVKTPERRVACATSTPYLLDRPH